MTLRERKKAKTREALAEAALELFAARGFDATTVDDIAQLAEVSRRTFFRYYPNKEAVLFPDRERRLVLFGELIQEAQNGAAPLEAVRQGMLAIAADYTRMRERVTLQQRIVESSPTLLAYDFELDRQWEASVATALEGPGRPSAAARRRARFVAGAVMGVIRATLREWYASDGRKDLVALGEEAFALIHDGIGNQLDTPDRHRRPASLRRKHQRSNRSHS